MIMHASQTFIVLLLIYKEWFGYSMIVHEKYDFLGPLFTSLALIGLLLLCLLS